MIAKWKWVLSELTGRLWVRAALYVMLGFAAVSLAWLVQPYIADGLSSLLGAGAVDAILGILASSMLAVTTFSLSIMVSALSGAAESASPRATALLLRDSTAQNVLATFLGAFLFSLVGIIALKAGVYTPGGRLVIFIFTLAVVAIIVFTFLRWIAHLSEFGRMRDVAGRVEQATQKAIAQRMKTPFLGGHELTDPAPDAAWPVYPEKTGYVQHLDTAFLGEKAESDDLTLYVAALPGRFVHTGMPILHVTGDKTEALDRELAAAFTIGESRDFNQDPRFGLVVMAEIASRALSPAVNDPGTAIDILGRGVRILAGFSVAEEKADKTDVQFPRLWVPALSTQDMFDDLFLPIARDGAGNLEVQIRLQKTLLMLQSLDAELFSEAARTASKDARDRARIGLSLDADIARIDALAAQFDKD